VPIDVERIVRAAAEAVLEGQDSQTRQASAKTKRKRLSGPRALMIGAGLFTAGRLLVRGRGLGLIDELQERLSDYESRFLGEDQEEDEELDEPADDGEAPEDEFDEAPEDELDEEEPEGEFEEDDEPEGEFDEDEVEEEDGGEAEEDDELSDEPESSPRTSSASGRRNGRH